MQLQFMSPAVLKAGFSSFLAWLSTRAAKQPVKGRGAVESSPPDQHTTSCTHAMPCEHSIPTTCVHDFDTYDMLQARVT